MRFCSVSSIGSVSQTPTTLASFIPMLASSVPVGGIYTVIKTKTETTVKELGEKYWYVVFG